MYDNYSPSAPRTVLFAWGDFIFTEVIDAMDDRDACSLLPHVLNVRWGISYTEICENLRFAI